MSRWPQRTAAERFAEHVEKSDNCWNWTGYVRADGYGGFKNENLASTLAHRWSYEHHVGPIPAGLVIDHLCRNRVCVNPAHLEAVTDRVNRSRGLRSPLALTCINGHEKTAENTYLYKGKRGCRTCRRAQRRACNARKKAA